MWHRAAMLEHDPALGRKSPGAIYSERQGTGLACCASHFYANALEMPLASFKDVGDKEVMSLVSRSTSGVP